MCPISRIKKGVSLPNRRRFMRKDRFKKDQVGVAAVIGTIMALLVFLTFLTVLVTTWIPVTMKDNERNHMNEVISQFSDIKSGVDNMMVYTSISSKPSLPTYQSVTLGAPGVPAFASPTAGFLSVSPKGSSNSMMKTTFTEKDTSNLVTQEGGGSVQMYAPNRYYVQQWVAYENGGILLKQDDGQVFRAGPSITFTNDSDATNIDLTQIDLIGANSSVGGTGIAGLNLDVIYVDSQSYTMKENSVFNITYYTNYGDAYFEYLNTTMQSIFHTGSVFTQVSDDGYNSTSTGSHYWRVQLINQGQGVYRVSLEINLTARGGTLILNQAFVNVELST
jgi:hypothetical protein